MSKHDEVERRNAKIAEFVEKGAEWCAKKLYAARQELDFEKHKNRRIESRLWEQSGINEVNENLKKILEKNGIRPIKLRLYYRECTAEECEDCYECEGCEDYIETISQVSFYSYKITDGNIKGILHDFNSEQFECHKIVDDRTGEVIWEETITEDQSES